ncbi:TolC family protein [Pedobacter sp. HMF7647]|uniref:TolC family protein n=1 Tax=Hufsiella arboris TaxID=2695275 RepID=A0A7K1Y8F7_9SPHI|nr:TolC family protein [Hufsiella arboris]MXV50872.1 TolC family protein [Hufsiella arboris]
MKFRKLLLLTALGVSATGGLYAQEKLTLQQAVQAALQNNLQIKQARLSEAISDENVKLAKTSIYPNLNASTNLFFNYGRSVDPTSYQYVEQAITTNNLNLSSNVILSQGRLKFNQISQNKYQLEADKSNTRKVENDLSLLVGTTYLQVLNNRDLLTAAQQQLAITRQQLDRAQKLFDVGNSTLADLSQAKSQVATAELNETNAQNQLDISYLDLAQLMERDPQSKFEVVSPDVDQMLNLKTDYTATSVYSQAVENYPDIVLARYNTAVAKKYVDIAKSYYYPTLSLGGALSSNYSSTGRDILTGQPNPHYFDQINQNFYKYWGFTLNIPLFNNLQTRIGVNKAKLTYQRTEAAEQLARNNFNKVINQAIVDLKAAQKQYYSTQSAYNSKKDAFTVIQQRFNVGLVNSLDFNQSQTDLNTAEFNFIQAKYMFIFRSKVIDFYLGNTISF